MKQSRNEIMDCINQCLYWKFRKACMIILKTIILRGLNNEKGNRAIIATPWSVPLHLVTELLKQKHKYCTLEQMTLQWVIKSRVARLMHPKSPKDLHIAMTGVASIHSAVQQENRFPYSTLSLLHFRTSGPFYSSLQLVSVIVSLIWGMDFLDRFSFPDSVATSCFPPYLFDCDWLLSIRMFMQNLSHFISYFEKRSMPHLFHRDNEGGTVFIFKVYPH